MISALISLTSSSADDDEEMIIVVLPHGSFIGIQCEYILY